jgi:hypothetical protein
MEALSVFGAVIVTVVTCGHVADELSFINNEYVPAVKLVNGGEPTFVDVDDTRV